MSEWSHLLGLGEGELGANGVSLGQQLPCAVQSFGSHPRLSLLFPILFDVKCDNALCLSEFLNKTLDLPDTARSFSVPTWCPVHRLLLEMCLHRLIFLIILLPSSASRATHLPLETAELWDPLPKLHFPQPCDHNGELQALASVLCGRTALSCRPVLHAFLIMY